MPTQRRRWAERFCARRTGAPVGRARRAGQRVISLELPSLMRTSAGRWAPMEPFFTPPRAARIPPSRKAGCLGSLFVLDRLFAVRQTVLNLFDRVFAFVLVF